MFLHLPQEECKNAKFWFSVPSVVFTALTNYNQIISAVIRLSKKQSHNYSAKSELEHIEVCGSSSVTGTLFKCEISAL